MEKSNQEPSFGQGLELSVIIEKALASAVKKNNTDSVKIQEVIGKPGVIFDFFEKLLADDIKSSSKPSILKLISSSGEKITIEPLDGQEFIYGAKDIFFHIDENFKNWGLNEPSLATTETSLDVYEMVENGTSKEIFTCISDDDDLEKLVMTQAQIKKFCKKHAKWLHQYGNTTFFLTKKGKEYFVVRVRVPSAGLGVDVRRFEGDNVWYGGYRHRVVVPQLKPLDS